MSVQKLLIYAAAGIIAGLWIENETMRAKAKAIKTGEKVKKNVATTAQRLKHQFHK